MKSRFKAVYGFGRSADSGYSIVMYVSGQQQVKRLSSCNPLDGLLCD